MKFKPPVTVGYYAPTLVLHSFQLKTTITSIKVFALIAKLTVISTQIQPRLSSLIFSKYTHPSTQPPSIQNNAIFRGH